VFNWILPGGRTVEPEEGPRKTENRAQLEERAIKYRHGDGKGGQEEDFGPYTRARIQCMQ
jgi:hypothetical protein